jgi:CheY-like chemotaxis protein
MKILIIDDEQDMRMIVRYAMTQEDETEVIEAENGPEGIQKAMTEHPDVILMDLKMAGMDGSTALASLKENPSTANIPVIFLTAVKDSNQNERLKKMGAAGVLPKPFDPVMLADRVRSILNKK